jgi:hypothetical protein
MNRTEKEQRILEMTRSLEARAARRSAEASSSARGLRPGDLVLAAGEPEWLIAGARIDEREWLLVPIVEGDPGFEEVLVLDAEEGSIALRLRGAEWVSRENLHSMRRSGAVSEAALRKVKEALGPVPKASTRRWIPFAAIAVSVLAGVFAFALSRGHERDRPGLYALRGMRRGEVGAELVVAGGVCRARGVADGGDCVVASGERIEVQYRLDPGMEHRFAAVIFVPEDGGPSRILFPPDGTSSGELQPTVADDGDERCARGFCPLVQVHAVSAEIRVIFAAHPVDAPRLLSDESEDSASILSYKFRTTSVP